MDAKKKLMEAHAGVGVSNDEINFFFECVKKIKKLHRAELMCDEEWSEDEAAYDVGLQFSFPEVTELRLQLASKHKADRGKKHADHHHNDESSGGGTDEELELDSADEDFNVKARKAVIVKMKK